MSTRVLTIKMPQIDGVSPMGLKKDIDYLITKELKCSRFDLKTEVVVTPGKPSKALRSRAYSLITGMSGDDDIILSDVTVDYPEQTFVEVTVQGCIKDSDLNRKICDEIKEYLCLYRVNVIDETVNSPNPEPATIGLELTACINQLDVPSRHRLKKDIDHIIKKVGVQDFHSDEAAEEQTVASSRHIQYSVNINDLPDDKKKICVVNVKLEGEADKDYYDTMWDINCKIKTYSM